MKRIMIILLILLEAAVLLAEATALSDSGFAGIHGQTGAVFSTPAADTKNVEQKMADALAKLDSWRKSQTKERIKPAVEIANQAELNQSNVTQANSTEPNLTSANSTSDNSSIISPSGNSSLESSSKELGANAGRVNANDASGPPGQNIGSSSEGRFKGYYGMTAARHEIGKSGINSHMFLSGDFEMDKAVKFQDQGID
jgi:hypothetical protein